MKRCCFIITAAAIAAGLTTISMDARRVRTRHSIPKESKKETVDASSVPARTLSMASDSIAFRDSILPAVRFSGFDKTAGSNTESFFITNGLGETLKGVEIQITYTDMKGRQLHKRTVKTDCDIPAGETRRADIKSWDTQRSFYYHRSLKPKRLATPFKVRIDLLSASLQ